ncbi:MAG: HlyD family secretion protein [Sphingobacterium sp.]
MMEEKKSRILSNEDLHSEDLQEIITRPPSWLMTRGISFILITLVLILSLSAFIRYPETIDCAIKFNTENAPKAILAQFTGHLVRLLEKDGKWVEKDQILAYLESTADHEQVLHLFSTLDSLRANNSMDYNLEKLIPPYQLRLGELQAGYQNFYLTYLNYVAVKSEGIYSSKINMLEEELKNLQKQHKKSDLTYELQKEQLKIAQREYDNYVLLADKKIISPNELQQKESALLAKQQTLPQMESNLITYESSTIAKNREIIELKSQIVEERKKFLQALNSFISEARIWKRKYVLSSPMGGKLIYTSFFQENQLIKENQILFYINPNSSNYYGEIHFPQSASGKVKQGQEVLIKVKSYPYQEYGYIHGKINYISDIPIQDSLFFAKVTLNRSSQDSLIRLKPGLYGDAEILTNELSVLSRIWNNVTASIKF